MNTATLKQEYSGRELARYDLEAVVNNEAQTLEASLFESRSRGYSEPLKNLLATLRVNVSGKGLDGELKFAGGAALSLNVRTEELYRRVKVVYTERPGTQYYGDLWLYKSGRDGIRATLYFQLPDTEMYTCSLDASRNHFAADVSTAGRKSFCLTADYVPSANGFGAEIEYLNLLSENPACNTGETPTRLKITRKNNHYSASLDLSTGGAQTLAATADLYGGQDGEFERLEINAVPYNRIGPDTRNQVRIEAVPGSVTYTDRTGAYELKTTEDKADKKVMTLTKNQEEELMTLTFSLEGETLRGVMIVSGQENASLTIEPIEKEPIEEITAE